MNKPRVFLGGTCNESTWRDELIKMLEIDHFNPIVEDWDSWAQRREVYEREHCDFVLYVITPLMTGSYAIAEAVDDSNKRPDKTVFCILSIDAGESFTTGQLKSLRMVSAMIENNGGTVFNNLEDVAVYLNSELNAIVQFRLMLEGVDVTVGSEIDDETEIHTMDI